MGITGAGKTCVMAVMLGEEPPENHNSTPLMRPVTCVTAVTLEKDSSLKHDSSLQSKQNVEDQGDKCKWIRKDPTEILKMLADLVKHRKLHRKDESVMNPPQPPITEDHSSTSSTPSNSSDGSSKPIQHKLHSGSEATVPSSMEHSEPDFETLLESCNIEEELLPLFSESEATVFYERFVHFLDSGGQPQFMEILPVFLKNTSACIFVMRLCDTLEEKPVVGYFKEGESVGKTFLSAHTNEEIFQQVIRTLHSFQSLESENEPPKILVVGTHKDKECECSQTRKAKNEKLNGMLTDALQDHVFCDKFSDSEVELIFAMNAQSPGDDDKQVVKKIREIIMEKCKCKKELIPLRWYIFMQKLLKMAELLKRKVLRKSECLRIAESVYCDEMSCKAALEFFTHLNQIFHFPNILPDVVFVDPMVLIDKISELVSCSYELHDGLQNEHEVRATVGELKKFRDFGHVSEKFLQTFKEHYYSGIFTPKELITLLRDLLVFGDISEDEWFMPSLLASLDMSHLEKWRSSGTQAMVILFPDNGPQNGMFCSLNCYLSSPANTYPKPWQIALKKPKPMCLTRNCMIFKVPGFAGTVTLTDYFKYFEVHVSTGSDCLQKLWGHVREAVFEGLEHASTTIGYINNNPQPAILCPAHREEDHLASIDEEKMEWQCLEDPSEYGKIRHGDYLWISPSKASESI